MRAIVYLVLLLAMTNRAAAQVSDIEVPTFVTDPIEMSAG